MSAINVNSITGRTGTHGPVLTGVTTATNGLNVTGGNVGIGTDNPGYKLHIGDGTSQANLRLQSGNSDISLLSMMGGTSQTCRIEFGDSSDDDIGKIYYDNSDNSMQFTTNTAERLRITSGGNVGIGITNPEKNLVVSSSSSPTIRINNSDSSITADQTIGVIEFKANDGSNDGDQVTGSIESIAQAAFTGQGSPSHLIFKTNGPSGADALTERLRILSTGGITFNGDTAAANALDDYEEGTWTPELADATTGGNVATATVNGRYVKIGSQVTVSLDLTNINTSGLTGGNAIYIRNLPYTIPNYTGTIRYTGPTAYSNMTLSNNYTNMMFVIQDSHTYMRLLKTSTSSADTASAVTISQIASGSADIRGSVVYSIS